MFIFIFFFKILIFECYKNNIKNNIKYIILNNLIVNKKIINIKIYLIFIINFSFNNSNLS